jgi:nucleoside-diphosphate-sugar epimerase
VPGAILLTGASGFLGTHLLRALVERGDKVVVARRRSSRIDPIVNASGSIIEWDIATPIGDLLSREAVDIVVHTATAYGRRGESLADVAWANVTMPLLLLEAARAAGARAFINSDTFSAKGETLPEGLEGYVLTKKHFREIALLATREGTLQFTNVVIEHMYGDGDRETKFFPTLIRALLDDVESFALTAGEQTRDFVHVSDVVDAYVVLIDAARRGARAGSVEVGTGKPRMLREVVERIKQEARARTELRFGALPYRKGELMNSSADLEPLRSMGWSPRVGVEEGIRLTIDAARRARGVAGVVR